MSARTPGPVEARLMMAEIALVETVGWLSVCRRSRKTDDAMRNALAAQRFVKSALRQIRRST